MNKVLIIWLRGFFDHGKSTVANLALGSLEYKEFKVEVI